jgi:asparagine synthase (glutamine-hydrolysing)
MFLLSKYISENTDVKVILSGEGSDELFGGYLYFKYAPNDTSFRNEIISLCNNLYMYDCLRADRTTAANGLELRPPFLDRDLIETVMKCRDLKRSTNYTKELIRRAAVGYLPDEILWGKKEAFSDAVSLSWVDAIKKHADDVMQNDDGSPTQAKLMMQDMKELFDHIEGEPTNEMLCYRMLFMSLECAHTMILPRLWLPNQAWVQTGVEPSARILSVYNNHHNN